MKKRMAVVAYTEYSRDARVRKATEAAVEAGFNVECLVLKDRHKIETFEGIQIKQTGIQQYRGNSNIAYIYSYTRFFLSVLSSLIFLTFKRKYHIIHVHNMPDFLVFSTILPKIFGAKIILDIHDSMPLVYKDKFSSKWTNILIYFLRLEERFSAFYSNAIITVHDLYRKNVLAKNKIPIHKISVIKNLADNKLFNPKKYPSISHTDNKLRLIFHGTIAERYGLKTILIALHKVVPIYPEIEFNIYGKGDDEENIKSLIQKFSLQNNVFLRGFIPITEIPLKIMGSDLGISSLDGLQDGLSVKMLEYISMELPVIASKNSVVDYYLGGYKLLYYNAYDSDEVTKHLINILNDRSILQKQKAELKRINADFNWQIEKQKLIDIYSAILK